MMPGTAMASAKPGRLAASHSISSPTVVTSAGGETSSLALPVLVRSQAKYRTFMGDASFSACPAKAGARRSAHRGGPRSGALGRRRRGRMTEPDIEIVEAGHHGQTGGQPEAVPADLIGEQPPGRGGAGQKERDRGHLHPGLPFGEPGDWQADPDLGQELAQARDHDP